MKPIIMPKSGLPDVTIPGLGDISAMAPEKYLARGAELIGQKLSQFGFHFAITDIGRGSGGPFAEGAFTRGDQQICLWVRHDRLGRVTYRAGTFKWSHSDYMRALGLSTTAQYPGFESDDLFGSFRRLLSDLDHCTEFLAGDGRSVAGLVQSIPPPPKGFKALGP
jgi:hypothetical protein